MHVPKENASTSYINHLLNSFNILYFNYIQFQLIYIMFVKIKQILITTVHKMMMKIAKRDEIYEKQLKEKN